MNRFLVYFALIVLMNVLAAPSAQAQSVEERLTARAEDAISHFQGELKTQLMSALKQGGPVAAISVCQTAAPAMAKSQSNERQQIGRTSLRLRNPDNKAPAWVGPLLERYEKVQHPFPPELVALDNGQWGYVKPIYTQSPCLLCHGQQVTAAVQQTLHQLYPGDQATGFAINELRGLFWVILSGAESQ